MSRGRAPRAMRMPISRERSVTYTSMIFMIHSPPPISEMAGLAEGMYVMDSRNDGEDLGNFRGILHGEIGLLAWRNPVPLHQQVTNLALGPRGECLTAGGDKNQIDVGERRGLQTLADRGVGHQQDVHP